MELSNYEQSLKQYRDYHNTVDYALEQGKEKGREEGRKEGKEEGLKEGLKQGIERGIEQGKLEMIKSMYANDVPLEQIVKISGLSRVKIEQILREA